MDKIGKIVGILVLLMIVGTSMVTVAEGVDASVGGENGDDHDYNDANILLSGDNTAVPQKTEEKGGSTHSGPSHSAVEVW